ncbi:MAG: D-serine deaminase-like pyridoxal phosphate-dependent protein [Candidatus Latescibacterota bacterium]|jgi:D-serine deaminase-like pyridoxal phosphate-dependent protein
MRIEELDTPSLIVDLDGLEDNIDRYQSYFDQHGIGLRPHIKTHKSIAIAHMQMRRGAIGITCQKLGEAEVMVSGGIDQDILIPFNIIGEKKLERLTALARRTRLTVAADSHYTVDGLSQAAAKAGVEVGVIVELDQGRTGVPTAADACALGQYIHAAQGLELRGIMIMPAPPSTRPFIQEVLAAFDAAGLPYPIVSGGSTPSAFTAHEIPELTEFRAGEYPVGGIKHLEGGTHTVAQCAGRILATVVSRPNDYRAIIDAGSKSLSAATASYEGHSTMGYIVEYPQARLSGASEEHGQLDLNACEKKPQIGERVQVILAHPCPCFNEHDHIYALRSGQVEAIWPVDARGKIH